MSASKKSDSIAKALYDKLVARGFLHVSQPDSQSVLIAWSSSYANDEANILVRIQPRTDDTGRVNAIGQPQQVFSPVVAQILMEEDSANPGQIVEGATYADRVSQRKRFVVLAAELARMGLKMEFWRENSAVHASLPVDAAAWSSATKESSLGDLYFPIIGET